MNNTLYDVIKTATATRWAWRDPTPEEDVPDDSGFYPLALRNESVRAVCLAFEFQEDWKLLWSIWGAERRDEGGVWRETHRFPRLEEIRNVEGRWQRRDFCVREDSPEWRSLCPAALKALVGKAAWD